MFQLLQATQDSQHMKHHGTEWKNILSDDYCINHFSWTVFYM